MLFPLSPSRMGPAVRQTARLHSSSKKKRDQEGRPGIGLSAWAHHQRGWMFARGCSHFFCTRIAARKLRVATDGLPFAGGVGCRDDMPMQAKEIDACRPSWSRLTLPPPSIQSRLCHILKG